MALQSILMELGNIPLYKVDKLQQPDEIERRLTEAYHACCDIGVALTKANMALALGLSMDTLNDWIAGKYNSRDGIAKYVDSAADESEEKAIMAVNAALKKWVIVSQSMLEIGSQINKTPAGSIFLLKAVHHLVEIEQEKGNNQLNFDSLLSLVDASV